MSKKLDPEIKALRAVERALAPLDDRAMKRGLEWVVARRLGIEAYRLPRFPKRRWISPDPYVGTDREAD